MSLTRSRKAKGRRLQNWVRDSLRGLFLALTDDDVMVAFMGERGADVKLSKKAKKVFPRLTLTTLSKVSLLIAEMN